MRSWLHDLVSAPRSTPGVRGCGRLVAEALVRGDAPAEVNAGTGVSGSSGLGAAGGAARGGGSGVEAWTGRLVDYALAAFLYPPRP